jgi:hypothetical protein
MINYSQKTVSKTGKKVKVKSSLPEGKAVNFSKKLLRHSELVEETIGYCYGI